MKLLGSKQAHSMRAVLSTVLLIAGICASRSQNDNSENDLCKSITDRKARAICNETANSFGSQANVQRTILFGGWRLVRTANPRGGADLIGIMHTAEGLKSDPNLVGLMLRCSDSQIEGAIVVVEPYPPLASIDLTIAIGNRLASKYRASVRPPGLMVELPTDAVSRILADQPGATDLNVSLVHGTGAATAGTIKITGLEQAFGTLKTLCSAS